jgi:hypothetical protein
MSDFDASPEVLGKIAASLGLGEAAPPQEVADAPGSETGEQPTDGDGLADFEWDGWKIQGPADKIESLKKGTLQHKDYTQKTQELAQSRDSVEQLRALNETQKSEIAFAQSISPEQQEIGMIDQYLGQVRNIDWSKLSSEQMMRQKIELDQFRDRRSALADSIIRSERFSPTTYAPRSKNCAASRKSRHPSPSKTSVRTPTGPSANTRSPKVSAKRRSTTCS